MSKSLFCNQVENLCDELGLVQDYELNKIRKDDLSYGIQYLPGDFYNYNTHGPDYVLIILRFNLKNNTVTVWDDYVIKNGKAIEQKGIKFTTYHSSSINKVRKKLESILHAYNVFVEQCKIITNNFELEKIKKDFK